MFKPLSLRLFPTPLPRRRPVLQIWVCKGHRLLSREEMEKGGPIYLKNRNKPTTTRSDRKFEHAVFLPPAVPPADPPSRAARLLPVVLPPTGRSRHDSLGAELLTGTLASLCEHRLQRSATSSPQPCALDASCLR